MENIGKITARLEADAQREIEAINAEAAEKIASEIRENGGEAIAIQANVLDKDNLTAAHETVLNTFGKCEVLINGAGGNNPKGTTTSEYFNKEDLLDENARSFFDLDKDGVSFVFNLNFLGTLLPTQAFAQDMLETGGCIVNISSMNAYTPLTKIPAYSGAKAAVSNFTQWLAVHFANCGIRDAVRAGIRDAAAHYGVDCLVLDDVDKQCGHPTVQGMDDIFRAVLATLEK